MSRLRTGYTTGSCAAAAAKAAALLLAEGRAVTETAITLPDGTEIMLPVAYVRLSADGADAAVVKDAGDDPDVTAGALVQAAVAWGPGADVKFAAGAGVGTVTKPGLALAPGEAAINPVPRSMITRAVREVTPRGIRVTISIPGGAEIARRTFNPRLGIVGGLSILGTTGIVRPFSCSALRASLTCALGVIAAAGIRAPVLVPGHIGERAARAHLRVPAEQVVEVGNEWGFVLDEALKHPFTDLLILGHPGKLAKLAAGDWDTHSGKSRSALPAVSRMHEETLGRPAEAATTVEGIFAGLDAADKATLGNALAHEIRTAVSRKVAGRLRPAVILIDLGGRIIGHAGDSKPWKRN